MDDLSDDDLGPTWQECVCVAVILPTVAALLLTLVK